MAADAWGVGCVGYFCLKGRPLFYGDEETVDTHHRIDCCALMQLYPNHYVYICIPTVAQL